MLNNKYGFTQLTVRADDVHKLRELKALGIISSMSSFVHFLILKEIQELKKQRIVRKRKGLEDRTMKLTNNFDLALEKYINKQDEFLENLGYKPVYDCHGEIMEWIK